jgi:hypothetical protein
VVGDEEHQAEDNDGDEGNHYVKEDGPDPGSATLFPIAELEAFGNADLVRMQKVVGEFAGAGIAILRIAFDGAIDDLLQLRRDRVRAAESGYSGAGHS